MALTQEKKSCSDCAYQRFNFFNELKFWTCRYDKSSIMEHELATRYCQNFIRKKQGVSLQQQIEEQKQQTIKQQQLEEQRRLTIEHNRLKNRLKRNWYYLTALTVGIVTLLITIWRLIVGR